jgi:TolB-like protein/DNA-binding SARP family transcriptional activator/Flp pilus assembly protein TadD
VPVYRLETFGNLVLTGGTAAGQAQQRRRLALLALLAASGDRGLTRDQLLGYLWPDSSAANARHSLEQLLHALRRTLDDSLFAGTNPLSLNPEIVSSDVYDFDRSLKNGDLRAAVALYKGEFLKGFYLDGADEFDRWAERERALLAHRNADALGRLAAEAEKAGDHSEAVRWRRREVDSDPVSSRSNLALMRALVASGDRTAALQHARTYEALVQAELETSPDPSITAYASSLRSRSDQRASAPAVIDHAPQAQPREVSNPPVTSSGDSEDLAPSPRGWSPYWIAVGTTIVIGALISISALSLSSGPREKASRAVVSDPSIAVLPLASLGADTLDRALAVGITEDLIATLARTGDVRVIASTSTSGFKNQKMDVRQIADSLGVSNILEGTVQKNGSQLRVEVRLVSARDGSTKWSQAYDRKFDDVFSLQDEIVRTVAGELGLRFDKDRQLRRHGTRSIVAYELYLRGSDPLLFRSHAGIWKSLDYFQRAIDADSTYAAAYAGSAVAQIKRGTMSDPGMPLREVFARAEKSARRALALDHSLPEAHYALGRVMEVMLNFPAAESEFKRAIALDPTRSVYHRGLSTMYGWAGRPADELAEAQRALETDPLNPYGHVALANGLFANRRWKESLAELDRISAIQPPLQIVRALVAQNYYKMGRLPEAIAALRPQAAAGDPMFRGLLGYMLARAGQREEARELLSDLLARTERTGTGSFQVGMVYAGLGDVDRAFAWFNQSIDDRSISDMIMTPTFEDLRTDSRFKKLEERLGIRKR